MRYILILIYNLFNFPCVSTVIDTALCHWANIYTIATKKAAAPVWWEQLHRFRLSR